MLRSSGKSAKMKRNINQIGVFFMSNKVEDKLKQLQEDKKKDNKRLLITLVLVIITIIIILLLLRCCSKKEDVPKEELPMDESQGAYKEQEYIDHSQNIR